MITNAQRADRARAAVDAYKSASKIRDKDVGIVAGDLICDLLHLVRRESQVDRSKMIEDAVAMNATEMAGDPEA